MTTNGDQLVKRKGWKTAMHPNSLKAIEPHQWQPGQSGNPKGQDPALLNTWRAIYQFERSDLTVRELEKIAKDKDQPVSKVTAAQWMIRMAKDGKRYVIGKDGTIKEAALDPEPGRERERYLDRVMGRPAVMVEQHHYSHDSQISPRELREQLIAMIRANPDVAAELLRKHPDLEPLLPVDTTAEVLPAAGVAESEDAASQQLSTAEADSPDDKSPPVFRSPDDFAKVATTLLAEFNEQEVDDAVRYGRVPQSLTLLFVLMRDHGEEFTFRQIGSQTEGEADEPRIVIEDREGRPGSLQPHMQESVLAMLRHELLVVGDSGALVPGKRRPDLRMNTATREVESAT